MAFKRKTQDLSHREFLRKQQHSQIEKRRREKTTDCMNQLHQLVPKNSSQSSIQKLHLLENTVEYIIELQRLLEEYEKIYGTITTSSSSSVTNINSQNYKSQALPRIYRPGSLTLNTMIPVIIPSPISPASLESSNKREDRSTVMDIDSLLTSVSPCRK